MPGGLGVNTNNKWWLFGSLTSLESILFHFNNINMSETLANVSNVSTIDMDTVEGVIWSVWNVCPDISRVHEKLLVSESTFSIHRWTHSLCARCVLQYRGCQFTLKS